MAVKLLFGPAEPVWVSKPAAARAFILLFSEDSVESNRRCTLLPVALGVVWPWHVVGVAHRGGSVTVSVGVEVPGVGIGGGKGDWCTHTKIIIINLKGPQSQDCGLNSNNNLTVKK